MSGRSTVSLHILDKDYVVACPEDECANLRASAEYLQKKMQEVKDSGKVVGTERILVMTALNIAHELIGCKLQKESYTYTIDSEARRLEEKITQVLAPELSE
jgi:cell division protein ZapA